MQMQRNGKVQAWTAQSLWSERSWFSPHCHLQHRWALGCALLTRTSFGNIDINCFVKGEQLEITITDNCIVFVFFSKDCIIYQLENILSLPLNKSFLIVSVEAFTSQEPQPGSAGNEWVAKKEGNTCRCCWSTVQEVAATMSTISCPI